MLDVPRDPMPEWSKNISLATLCSRLLIRVISLVHAGSVQFIFS